MLGWDYGIMILFHNSTKFQRNLDLVEMKSYLIKCPDINEHCYAFIISIMKCISHWSIIVHDKTFLKFSNHCFCLTFPSKCKAFFWIKWSVVSLKFFFLASQTFIWRTKQEKKIIQSQSREHKVSKINFLYSKAPFYIHFYSNVVPI